MGKRKEGRVKDMLEICSLSGRRVMPGSRVREGVSQKQR